MDNGHDPEVDHVKSLARRMPSVALRTLTGTYRLAKRARGNSKQRAKKNKMNHIEDVKRGTVGELLAQDKTGSLKQLLMKDANIRDLLESDKKRSVFSKILNSRRGKKQTTQLSYPRSMSKKDLKTRENFINNSLSSIISPEKTQMLLTNNNPQLQASLARSKKSILRDIRRKTLRSKTTQKMLDKNNNNQKIKVADTIDRQSGKKPQNNLKRISDVKVHAKGQAEALNVVLLKNRGAKENIRVSTAPSIGGR